MHASRATTTAIKKKECKICKTKLCQRNFTRSEWIHASWRDSQGKCNKCMLRAPKGWRRCGDCRRILPIKQFNTNARSNNLNTRRRCNTCITLAAMRDAQSEVHDKEQQQSTIEQQQSTITRARILCMLCNSPKDILFDKLWKRDGTIRLCQVHCRNCKRQIRLGHWYLPNNEHNDNVETWLKRCSYNGISFFKLQSQPPTATVELFSLLKQPPL